jgi:cell division protein FtsQ
MIYRIAGLALILVFIGVTLGFTTIERRGLALNAIHVTYSEPNQFVSESEIKQMVNRNFKWLKGAMLDTVNTQVIEYKIEEHPWVKNAEVFKGYSFNDSTGKGGRIIIKIEQEKPVLRVMTENGGYYMNQDGKTMPLSSTHTSNVIVITGNATQKMVDNELLPFIDYINSDKFWKALFQQIHIHQNGEFLLVPRVGDHRIEFGTTENMEKKLRNLKLVYTKGFNNGAWDKYRTVTLKYNNQVVCTLR